MRIFAKEWVSTLLQRLGYGRGRAPSSLSMISQPHRGGAEKRWKGRTFEARKHLLEYDDVMNKQRTAVYGLRGQLLEGLDQKELILSRITLPTCLSARDGRAYAGGNASGSVGCEWIEVEVGFAVRAWMWRRKKSISIR